jgi:hypothetical protein
MATNADIEMRWVDAWNDLNDIVRGRYEVACRTGRSSPWTSASNGYRNLYTRAIRCGSRRGGSATSAESSPTDGSQTPNPYYFGM